MRAGRWVIVGLVLFIAADVVLVAMTFRHVATPPPVDTTASRSPSAAASPSPSPSPSSSPSPAPSRTESPTSSPTSQPSRTKSPTSPGPSRTPAPTSTPAKPRTVTTSAPVAFLAVGQDGALLRTSRGDCPGSRRPDVTVATRTDQAPAARRVPGLRTVVGAQAVSRRNLAIVGLNQRCRAGVYSSGDGGRTWARRAGDAGQWHLNADPTARSVVSPTGRRHTPCVPRSLSPLDATAARVLCRDGVLLGTEDVGGTWITLGRLPGAVDIRYTAPGAAVALATLPKCPAAAMQTSDGGATWQRLACIPGRRPLAVAAQGSVMAAQVGTRLYVSTDSGSHWRDLHWDK